MATVKDRIVALCKARGITVNKLQKETGIGNVVSHWNEYNPRMDKLAAVATYLNVPIESLLYDDLPEQKENPVTFNRDEEYEDAIRRGQYAYFIDLLDRSTPEARDAAVALLISKLQNQ